MDKSIEEFYGSNYSKILSTGILGRVQNHLHTMLDRCLIQSHYEKILEVGAGNLEHVKNTKISFATYIASDIQRIRDDRYVNQFNNVSNSQLKVMKIDAQKLDFPENEFDLLIATCLLIHLPFPEQALLEWRRVIKHRGEMVIYVPCDPGLMIRAARFLFVLPKHLLKKSSKYQLICAREHICSLFVLNKLIREVFKNDEIKIKRWPFWLPSWNLNLAYIYHISVIKN